MHPDPFDVPRPQRPTADEETPLDHRCVVDHIFAMRRHDVETAERVVPVVLTEVAREDHVQKRLRLGQQP